MSEASTFYAPWPVKLPQSPAEVAGPVWELALLQPRQGEWSLAQYLELTDGTNWLIEFDNGRVEFLSMPTPAHQLILLFLMDAMRAFAEPNLGRVLMCGLRVATLADKVREPDLAFLAKENLDKQTESLWESADLVMEIVSPDENSRSRDYVLKRSEYALAGIPEYWIVDPQEEQITVLTLPEGASEYAEHGVFKPGEQATSVLLEGFSVSVTDVFDAARK